ncbi:MAG: glycosyltransferase family 2 protein [Patescibacteria group bacterium]
MNNCTGQVSCIIAAYNEGPRIAHVLRTVIGHPLVHEIIVVDDGSADNTKEVVSQFPQVHLLALEKNGGKSHAVAEGIQKAAGEFIFLLDADLAGLSPEYLTSLIEPIISGKADISISLRGNTFIAWRWIGLDYISGERVFAKKFINPLLERISRLHGFGLEVYMNKSIIKQKLRIAVVRWDSAQSAFKHQTPGQWWLFGIKKDYIRMAWLVMKTIPPWEALWQIWSMRRQRV